MAEAEPVRAAALRLLAGREHSVVELTRKLRLKGHEAAEVEQVAQALLKEGLLSDERFVEAFVRSRIERGSGPVRIRVELAARGIDEAAAGAHLDLSQARWRELAESARGKRFGAVQPREFKERARQARFLEYRGFTAEQIRAVLDADD